ncbi:MAG: hypothetical protein JWR77_2025 [Rhizorhabdus sp.]|nr:hypothetical protein [Rhizorhabdus sp.]
MKAIIRGAAIAAAILSAPAFADAPKPPPSLAEALVASRHVLTMSPAGFGGDGAPILRKAVEDARYVAIGEDHITREIPAFAQALCDVMAPQGLSALALEIGPVVTEAIRPMLTAPDRIARMAAFNAQYPHALAFLDTSDDNAMAAHCLKTAPGLRIIGADQEFIGSAGLLLDRILATKLSADAAAKVRALREQDRQIVTAARESGDPSGLLMLSITPAQVTEVQAVLDKGGNPQARALFAQLRESHEIYDLNSRGDPESNATRARLLKRNLAQGLPAAGRVLLKFGDWHLYKGFNPLGQRDLGNYVAERADLEGSRSLHILVLGAKGVHALFGGFAKPLRLEPFVMSDDSDYRWLKLATDRQAAQGWSLFDLRALRHRRIEGIDIDWRRAIDGYDLLLIIPELTPGTLIAAP